MLYIIFIPNHFVYYFLSIDRFFENYENATCSSDTTLRCTISLSDSCITLNGATSTSYQCNNGRKLMTLYFITLGSIY